jgi:hypothetical protein
LTKYLQAYVSAAYAQGEYAKAYYAGKFLYKIAARRRHDKAAAGANVFT